MSEPRSNTLRRGLVVAVILTMAGFIAFGHLPPDGFPFQRYDAHLHFSAFATITTLAVIAWPRATIGHLFAGLAMLAGLTELLQFVPGLNRTPSLSDFGFNICGIATVLGVVTVLRTKARS